MNRRFTNTTTRVPIQAGLSCAALNHQHREATLDEMRELRGGYLQILLRLALTTLASFEAGYQYGRFRDNISRPPEPEADGPSNDEQPERPRPTLQTAAPDNTRVGS